VGVAWGSLAKPVLGHRGGQASKAPVLGALARLVIGASEAHRGHGGRLGLHAQVGQHVDHQRLVDQPAAERAALGGVVQGMGHPLAHDGGPTHAAVQPRVGHHLDDGGHASSLLTDQPGQRPVQLDLRGGVGAVAELVLEPLQVEGVARPVGEHAGNQEARQPAGSLGQHEEHVAHRGRAEPLVPSERVLPARAPAVDGLGHRRVGPHVRPALLLGHGHAGQQAPLAGRRTQAGVVVQRGQARLPVGRQLGLGPKRRNDGVGHRDGTPKARLHA